MTLTPEMWKLVVSQGIFALLFVSLLIYVLKQNAKREDQLIDCLKKLAPVIERIESEVCTIKDFLGINSSGGHT